MRNFAERLWQFPSVLMAWRNLGRNRIRSGLAVLGIVIGVLAIASLGMGGAALQHQATQNLGTIGNEVKVMAAENSSNSGLTQEQVSQIEEIATDAQVVPMKSNETTLSENGAEVNVSVRALTQADALYDVEAGDVPKEFHSGALISSDAADKLELEVGDTIEYNGEQHQIRGITKPTYGIPTLILPLSAESDQENYTVVSVIAENGEEAGRISDAIERAFNRQDKQVNVLDGEGEWRQAVGSFMETLTLGLLGVGSISLVVAGLAILNVMLMSTVERRGEIGVLRSVGIRRREVLRMFLTEATFIGLIGGIVGVVGSLAVGLALFHVLTGDMMLILSWSSLQYLLYGFGFAIVASLLSGLYPAWKAANERPVDSLRG